MQRTAQKYFAASVSADLISRLDQQTWEFPA
jgi:hypothetical protein